MSNKKYNEYKLKNEVVNTLEFARDNGAIDWGDNYHDLEISAETDQYGNYCKIKLSKADYKKIQEILIRYTNFTIVLAETENTEEYLKVVQNKFYNKELDLNETETKKRKNAYKIKNDIDDILQDISRDPSIGWSDYRKVVIEPQKDRFGSLCYVRGENVDLDIIKSIINNETKYKAEIKVSAAEYDSIKAVKVVQPDFYSKE